MRRGHIILALGAAAVGIPLAALALCGNKEFAGPSSALWRAIVAVESGGHARAYNPCDGATGMAQIRSVCLTDVNRIARLRGVAACFRAADRWDPRAARRMWDLYLGYYGKQYEKETGRKPTDEVFARIWNGGPTGWQKTSTLPYWARVREAMKSAPAKDVPLLDEAEDL
jgi:hypothetical protein